MVPWPPTPATDFTENRPETPRYFYTSESAQARPILSRQSHEREPTEKDFSPGVYPEACRGSRNDNRRLLPLSWISSFFIYVLCIAILQNSRSLRKLSEIAIFKVAD